MATNTDIYRGKGSVHIGLSDGSGPRVRLGNCPQLTKNVETEEVNLPDSESAGGGNVASDERISNVSIEVQCNNFSPENLAIATRGAVTAYAGGTITDEAHADIFVDGLVKLDHMPVTSSIVVKRGATPLVLDSDYEITGRSGITPLSGGTNTVVDGDDLLISYTAKASNLVHALLNSGLEYSLFFDGLNEAKSGKAVWFEAYKCKPSPSSLNLIADEYGVMTLNFKVIKDSTKNGTTESQYYDLEIES
jgi:hypothetical protein